MNYTDYIHSSVWKNLRENRLTADGRRCRTCGNLEDLEVHHVYAGPPQFAYPAKLGEETLEDLITLCRFCHEAITDTVRRRRETFQPKLVALEQPDLLLKNVSRSGDVSPPLRCLNENKNIQDSWYPAVVDAQRPTFRSFE